MSGAGTTATAVTVVQSFFDAYNSHNVINSTAASTSQEQKGSGQAEGLLCYRLDCSRGLYRNRP